MSNFCEYRAALTTPLITAVLLAFGSTRLAAEPDTSESSPEASLPVTTNTLTSAEIEARRKSAAEASDLSDEIKNRIAELYQQSLEQLEKAEQFRVQAAQDDNDTKNVQERVNQVRGSLDDLAQAQPQVRLDGKLAELEQQLAEKGLELEKRKAEQAKLEMEPATRATARKEIRSRLLALPQKLEEAKQQFSTPPPADEPAALTLARRTELVARQIRLKEELPARQHELAKYDAEEAGDLIRLQRDRFAQQVAIDQKEFDLLTAAVLKKRNEVAKEAVDRAKVEAFLTDPLLKPLADENLKMAEEAQSLTKRIAKIEESVSYVKGRLDNVRSQFDKTTNKVNKVGLTGPIGLLLRKQRSELNTIRFLRRRIRQRRETIDNAQLAYLEYDERRSDLSNLEPHVQRILNGVSYSNEQELQCLEESAQSALDSQREYVNALSRSYNTYFETLVELDTTQVELLKLTQEYQNYVDERVLWIRSVQPLFAGLELNATELSVVDGAQWRALPAAIWQDAKINWVLILFAGLLFGGALFVGRSCRRQIAAISEVASRSTCSQFIPTVRTAVHTVFAAIPVPALVLFVSWRLAALSDGNEASRGLSQGLAAIGWGYLVLELIRQICRPNGLAEAHFDWPLSVTNSMRRNLTWMMRVLLPLVLLTNILHSADLQHGHAVLERLTFVLGAMVMALILYGMLSPAVGLVREYTAAHPGGWVDRLKYLLRWAGVAAVLFLAGLSISGYHYTARHLSYRMFTTLALVASLVVCHALFLRLILVMRRRLAIAEARRRRAEMAETAANPTDPTALNPQQLLAQTELRIDFKEQSAKSQRLVTTATIAASLVGLWLIWTDVVPALGFLDRWPLWTTTVTQSVLDEVTGETLPQAREEIRYITLADVGLALILAVLGVAAVRNLPGLLEIAILRRLPLENSIRYAITSLAGYLIMLVGVIAVCNVVGLRWSQIQWLATALTFGLAFGLQEMFANFVAGLILLFERPIRVGDIVTVDDTTGIVSKIRIRATTIINWDRKEFIVPNKEFITGKLLNWTLSDQVNRIVVNVGVAYGSDTEQAKEILLRVAKEHPLVLDDPPSLANFEGFGDSCLNFVLRTYLPNMENRLAVIHDLHTAIDKAFREARIEIAFPQRDLHIRSITDLQLPASVQSTGQSKSQDRSESKMDASSAAA